MLGVCIVIHIALSSYIIVTHVSLSIQEQATCIYVCGYIFAHRLHRTDNNNLLIRNALHPQRPSYLTTAKVRLWEEGYLYRLALPDFHYLDHARRQNGSCRLFPDHMRRLTLVRVAKNSIVTLITLQTEHAYVHNIQYTASPTVYVMACFWIGNISLSEPTYSY